jgi:dephospho-CoA kinase
MIVIGVTGGSGAGKSTVANAFGALGGHVIDADKVYHNLLEESAELRKEILQRFPDAGSAGGGIDRKSLSEIVFSDENALSELNAITHKYVIHEIEEIIGDCYRRNVPFVVIDAIALFESGTDGICDITVCVVASIEERVKRITRRDNIPEVTAIKRISAQPGSDFYLNKCDFTIVNDGSDMKPEDEVKRIYNLISGDGSRHENEHVL